MERPQSGGRSFMVAHKSCNNNTRRISLYTIERSHIIYGHSSSNKRHTSTMLASSGKLLMQEERLVLYLTRNIGSSAPRFAVTMQIFVPWLRLMIDPLCCRDKMQHDPENVWWLRQISFVDAEFPPGHQGGNFKLSTDLVPARPPKIIETFGPGNVLASRIER